MMNVIELKILTSIAFSFPNTNRPQVLEGVSRRRTSSRASLHGAPWTRGARAALRTGQQASLGDLVLVSACDSAVTCSFWSSSGEKKRESGLCSFITTCMDCVTNPEPSKPKSEPNYSFG